jgi:hypothetical protein
MGRESYGVESSGEDDAVELVSLVARLQPSLGDRFDRGVSDVDERYVLPVERLEIPRIHAEPLATDGLPR